ncbi:MAG: hypothetical protein MJE66_06300 [Proteobacteria bacterium]|nr:hypothetical protein [Pseudomonadota bacterium]
MEPTQAAEVEPATPRSGSTTRRSTLIRAAIVCLPRNRTWSDDDLERHVFFIQALYCHLVANALVGLYELVAGTTMAATVAVGAIGASAGTALALTRRGWPIHLLASGHLLIFLAVLTWSIQAGAAAPGAHVLLYFAFVPIAAAFLIGPHGAIAFGLITAAAFAFLATTTDSGALRGARGWFESIVPLACISAFGWVTERLRHRSAARLQLALAARRQAEEEALNAHRDLEAQVEERIRLEAELVQAQKLEAIGQLAAGIAHEVNTPTQYVGDNLDFLREAFDDTVEALLKYRELHQICSQQAPTRELLAEIDQVVEAADLDFLL